MTRKNGTCESKIVSENRQRHHAQQQEETQICLAAIENAVKNRAHDANLSSCGLGPTMFRSNNARMSSGTTFTIPSFTSTGSSIEFSAGTSMMGDGLLLVNDNLCKENNHHLYCNLSQE